MTAPVFQEPYRSALASMMRTIELAEPDKRLTVFKNQFSEAIGWPADAVEYPDLWALFIEQAHSSGLVDQIGAGNLDDLLEEIELEHFDSTPANPKAPIRATPYRWREPSTIPRREWLYGYLLIRKFVSACYSACNSDPLSRGIGVQN